jgi:hypothetical protein
MLSKKPLSKLKLKKISDDKIIDNILKYEKENHFELMKLFHRKPQKLHQLYSKNAVIMQEDEEKYNGFLPLMNKYNKLHDQNISKYNQKKDENKNFLKQYIGYKLYNRKICKDDIPTLFGNLLPLYNEKKFFFSNKFLSGKKIFQDSALLINDGRHLNEYYKKMANIDPKKGKRDLTYLNQINLLLEEKIEKEKIKALEKEYALLEKYGGIKKKYFANKLERYKRTKEYKQKKRMEAMKALEQFTMKQKEIENDKIYVQRIKDLIEIEEKEKSYSKNNKSSNNIESENNNSLFILNRYQNNKYNNKINASNTLQKNRSSVNIQSSLYKETTNSTTVNNIETRQTIFNHNNPIRIRKRNSVNSNLDFSRFTLNDTHENKDNTEYININDTTNKENPLNLFNQSPNNNSSTKFQTKYKSKRYISSTKNEKNEESSNITNNDFNKTNNYLLSDYANISTKKRGRNTLCNPIRNIKKNFDISKFSLKMKEKETEKKIRNLSMMNQTLDERRKSDLKMNLFNNFKKIDLFVYMRNNHEFKNFCDTSLEFVPKKVSDKINKSFELDDKLQKAHIDYVKVLMEQKISKYYDKGVLYNY